MPLYQIHPHEAFFFRDARPMNTAGFGASWPQPNVFFMALHAALHRMGEKPEWAKQSAVPYYRRENGRRKKDPEKMQYFTNLRTAGPFPWKNNTTDSGSQGFLFPAPGDVTALENGRTSLLAPAKPDEGSLFDWGGGIRPLAENLRILHSRSLPSKEELPGWWSKRAFDAYLRAESVDHADLFHDGDLFAGEWATGIGVDRTSGMQDGERIYSAASLRLKPEITIALHASMPRLDDDCDGLNDLFPQDGILVAGGQQRLCQVVAREKQPDLAKWLPISAPVGGERVKWVLLTPALFPATPQADQHPGGWLPNWICPHSGEVLLKQEMPAREPGEARYKWRRRCQDAPPLNCRLVAARIPKPLVVTGWSERANVPGAAKLAGPRPTRLAVAPGAVYYFEGNDAPRLAARLAWHGGDAANLPEIRNRPSGALGEQGFGIGVCGPWND